VSQDFQEIMQKGVAAAKSGNREEASEFFRRATEINPNDIRGWLYWARVSSNTQQAKAAVKRALEIEPGNSQAKQMLTTLGGNEKKRSFSRSTAALIVLIPVVYLVGILTGYFLFSSDKSESSASKVEAIPPTATFTPTLTLTYTVTPTPTHTLTSTPTLTPRPSETPTPISDPVDARRSENLVRNYLEESALYQFGEYGIFDTIPFNYTLAIGSHWVIGTYGSQFESAGRYRVSVPISYDLICASGSEVEDCDAFFREWAGFDMPNCVAEWLVILDTQEVVDMNDCATIFQKRARSQ